MVWLSLLIPIPIFVWVLPKSLIQRLCLVVSVPIAALSGLFALAASFDDPTYRPNKEVSINNLTFSMEIVEDVTYDWICKSKIVFRIERSILGGLMKQRVAFLEIIPARRADMAIDEAKRTISVTSPAVENRKETARLFISPWEDLFERPCEIVGMSPK